MMKIIAIMFLSLFIFSGCKKEKVLNNKESILEDTSVDTVISTAGYKYLTKNLLAVSFLNINEDEISKYINKDDSVKIDFEINNLDTLIKYLEYDYENRKEVAGNRQNSNTKIIEITQNIKKQRMEKLLEVSVQKNILLEIEKKCGYGKKLSIKTPLKKTKCKDKTTLLEPLNNIIRKFRINCTEENLIAISTLEDNPELATIEDCYKLVLDKIKE
jgi:hypothetical protein